MEYPLREEDEVQFRFKGIKLSGQLNIELANANTTVQVEMSQLL